MDFNQAFVQYNNVPIEVIKFDGESDRDFVFIGGFADPVQNHVDILQGIAKKGFNVYAINMPGHGNSGFLPQIDWNTLVDILRACIIDLSLDRFTIGGFSMGGGVALKYASENPERIEYVRVLSPLCYRLPHLPTLIKSGIKFYLNFVEHARENPSKKAAPFPIKPIYYAQSYGGILEPLEVNKESLVDLEIHIIVGDADEIIDIERIREEFGYLPSVEIKPAPGFGHDIYYVPEGVIGEIVNDLLEY